MKTVLALKRGGLSNFKEFLFPVVKFKFCADGGPPHPQPDHIPNPHRDLPQRDPDVYPVDDLPDVDRVKRDVNEPLFPPPFPSPADLPPEPSIPGGVF